VCASVSLSGLVSLLSVAGYSPVSSNKYFAGVSLPLQALSDHRSDKSGGVRSHNAADLFPHLGQVDRLFVFG
jgi:hypothetical protein